MFLRYWEENPRKASVVVQMSKRSTRLLTIKAGKDAVCGGLSAAGRGKLPVCSNEVTLCNSSMTL